MATYDHEKLGAVGRAAAVCLAAIILAAVPMSGALAAQHAAGKSAAASEEEATAPEIAEPARRLRAWPRSSRHWAGIRLAPASAAGPGHRSAVTQEA